MVESSLETVRRLLNEALEECSDGECNFRVRTALQVLVAVQEEIENTAVDRSVLESVVAADPELRARLRDLEVLDES